MTSDSPAGKAYDAVVVGAGLGGLTAAALLADAGLSVLVVERQEGPGGVAHMFRRGPYSFDPGIHVMAMWDDGLFLDNITRHLGVRDRVHPILHAIAFGASFPGLRVKIPRGWEALVEAHVDLFPRHAAGIRKFMDLVRDVHEETHQCPPNVPFDQLDTMAERFPHLFGYARRSVGEALAECLDDPGARAFAGASWPWYGEPPSRLAMLWYSQVFRPMCAHGLSHLLGGFQTLADALVLALERRGGELVFGRAVSHIRVRDGRVAGVALEGGPEVSARLVVSNADATATLTSLLDSPLPETFAGKLRRLRPSLSAFAVYTATDLDLRSFEPAHETFHYLHWDHDRTLADVESGRPGGIWISIPTLVDPTLAPPGQHIAIISAMARYDLPWAELKQPYTELLLDQLEGLFPGYRSHLRFVEAATPLTIQRMLGTRDGAIYGWAMTPTQVGTRRLQYRTPIEGLYLVGAWTVAGQGSPRAVLSGLHASQVVLKDIGAYEKAFHSPDVPSIAEFLPETARAAWSARS